MAEFAGTKFDVEDMTRAEQAVVNVLSRYPTLLADEINKLRGAWFAAPETLTSETVASIFNVAHELAGYGGTFGYPLITILGRSLCRLLTTGDLSRNQMSAVVDAHIATLHVIVREQMKGPGGSSALALAAGLDQAINKFHLSAGSERKGRLQEEIAALQAAEQLSAVDNNK
ncbi:MAG TPA: hypothetical protein VG328_02445 [Stellaceae bacterium]|nr:hypothetical protein [Stellaceae bacterium]